ncbi:acyl-CoA dehydrogenase family protein [Alkalihalobacillus trypoxylicola]|uniref:acyl-CoA dehydrogenase family protein n=1 Tax=Alkalihalobacillus trypoxylicola TaxID=519424 RepID=UPI000A4CB78D|nr:acyl-CoA dehydrogenase family protein [Alkalihalobacillus trypoxylicola]
MQFLEQKSAVFKERAALHDLENTFPFENFEDLKEIGYPALTVPKRYGGLEISLLEMVQYQEVLGKADGSTSLSIGWHMGIIKHLNDEKSWDESMYEKVAKNIVKTGALLNTAASEPATGSPTRGGRPETTAILQDDYYIINGHKTFTTLAPVLHYFVVTTYLPEEEKLVNLLVPRGTEGLKVEETWNTVGMRGTGSHDLLLENVKVPKENLVESLNKGRKAAGWLLHIPACYLGIAQAAQEDAIQFAKSYSPNSIEGTIADLPNVKQKIGEMELLIQESKHFLYSVARKWDESSYEERQKMTPELGAVKHAVVNHAQQIVDLAMRVVGAQSLALKNPLQRYYRDVRAGLHNPPMDDMTIMLLASEALKRS